MKSQSEQAKCTYAWKREGEGKKSKFNMIYEDLEKGKTTFLHHCPHGR